MDSLHGMLRSMRTPPRRDHLAVFREFLAHLDRAGRRASARDVKARQGSKPKGRRGKGS
jgi:hypothetical protein